jgi:hypothetical protein
VNAVLPQMCVQCVSSRTGVCRDFVALAAVQVGSNSALSSLISKIVYSSTPLRCMHMPLSAEINSQTILQPLLLAILG